MKTARKSAEHPMAAGAVLSVREAKAQFSALLVRVAQGEEITIAWHGRPRARLAPLRDRTQPLRVDREWLRSMRVRGGASRSEALVRTDRETRG